MAAAANSFFWLRCKMLGFILINAQTHDDVSPIQSFTRFDVLQNDGDVKQKQIILFIEMKNEKKPRA